MATLQDALLTLDRLEIAIGDIEGNFGLIDSYHATSVAIEEAKRQAAELRTTLQTKLEAERLADPENWACGGNCESIDDSRRNRSLAAIRAETCAGCGYKYQYETPRVEPRPVRVVMDRDFEGHHVLLEEMPGTPYCTRWYRLTIDGVVRDPEPDVWWDLQQPTDDQLRRIIAEPD